MIFLSVIVYFLIGAVVTSVFIGRIRARDKTHDRGTEWLLWIVITALWPVVIVVAIIVNLVALLYIHVLHPIMVLVEKKSTPKPVIRSQQEIDDAAEAEAKRNE